MKLSSLFPSLLVAFVANANAAESVDFIANFDGLIPPAEIAGQGGWAINDSTTQLSFASPYAGSTAASLGGFYDSATESTVGLNHAYEATLSRTTATFDFTIIDSTNAFPTRDEFAFSWYSGSTNLFSVIFAPLDPLDLDPDGDTDAGWELFYSANGGPRTTLSIVVVEGGGYSFDLALTPQNTQTGYELSVFSVGVPGGPLNPLVRNGSFNVAPATTVDSFAFEWTPTAPGGGDNYLVFDNVTAVPEPSAAVLAGLAGLAFIGSRRRRA